ncbi:Planctomycete cytochrome C [Stieleria neptunia]|uniref:Planctomycete cytochrome C n=2 Tax=Stieleria neptunia TaxID=2527979 RepID=A0A518HY83_9BACT|nr:Planctomycete cytochrome C [Stieleria neptunia]
MNPYRRLLGIETSPRPNLFELLGLSEDETNPQAIKEAANAQMQKLRQHKSGQQGGADHEACKQLAAEIKRAYQVLASPPRRQDYLSKLSATRQSSSHTAPTAQSMPVPSADTAPDARSSGKAVLFVAAGLLVLVGLGGAAYFLMGGVEPAVVASKTESSPQPVMAEPGPEDTNAASKTDPPSSAAGETLDPAIDASMDPALRSDQSSETISERNAAQPSPVEALNTATSESSAGGGTVEQTEVMSSTQVTIPTQQSATQSSELPRADTTAHDSASSSASENPHVVEKQLATAAEAILRRNCYRCHGENESDEGGFGFVTSRKKLISSGFVVPGSPKDSLLFERMVSAESPMPPGGESPRPTDEDVETIRNWIQSGSKPFKESVPQQFVSTDAFYEFVARDLNTIPAKERVYVRYFSTTHLANAGYSDDELEIYRTALAKLLNSLSWNRQLANLRIVNNLETVYRIDLRDLKWTDTNWKSILAAYPYGLMHPSEAAVTVRAQTHSQIPVVRADWFTSAASRPPLYHVLAQIPATDRQLEQLLQLDVQRNLEEMRVVRAGFTRSGVSQHNRLIERHESIFGAYWKSYDFAGSAGRRNLFDLPMGPGETATDFEHDGGEIIFHLPNGMLAYMLVDAEGKRIDKGPTSIVSDPRQPDRAVVNGVSCMSCHYGGFIQKSDEVRQHVLANKAAYPKADDILDLYPDAETLSAAIAKDTKAYLTALAASEIGIEQPTQAGEPIVLASLRYNGELDLPLASAELGVTPESMLEELRKLSDANLIRRVGSLLRKGGVVKRETFVDSFFQLANALKLGRRATVAMPNAIADAPRQVPAQPPAPAIKRMNISSLPMGTKPGVAEQALATARRLSTSTKWRDAAPHFEIAIRAATTATIRLKVCEEAVEFYQRMDSVEAVLDVYCYIIHNCRTPREVNRTREQMLATLQAMIRKDPSWSHPIEPFQWPLSTTRAIANTFEPQLAKFPNHEPTLLVLDHFYSDIQRDNTKHLVVLERLDKILRSRGERMEIERYITLANLMIEAGNGLEAARLTEREIHSAFGTQKANLYLLQAAAWVQAGNKSKAMTSLKLAFQEWRAARSHAIANAYVEMGDLYMRLEERDLAAERYRSALIAQAPDYSVEQLQAKLAQAVGQQPTVAAMPDGQAGAAAAPPSDESLLDPKRRFAIAAAQAEANASTHPTLILNSMMEAADLWLKAGDNARAIKAIKKASAANKRAGTSARSNHDKLAKLFVRAGDNQAALNQWILALRSEKLASSISGYQIQIEALMQEDASLTLDEQTKPLLDPKYAPRVQAKEIEASRSYDASGRAMNLLRAAGYWNDAGEKEEALRCIATAEKAIDTIASGANSSRSETPYVQAAEAYAEHGKPADEVRCLVAAVKHCRSDSSAQRYFEKIKLVCRTHSLPIPNFDAEVAKRLDPLNRYRVQAANYHNQAKQTPSSAGTYYRMAVDAWARAEEYETGLVVANEWATLLLKDKEDRQYESNLGQLADLYVKLKRVDLAKKAYAEQLKVTTSDSRKRSVQRKIDRLNESE